MDPEALDAAQTPAKPKRWTVTVHVDDRDRQIIERTPLPPHAGPITYHGTVLMMKVFNDGLQGQRQWVFQIPGATVNEAFDAYEPVLEKAKAQADAAMEQQHTHDALSGRLPGRPGQPVRMPLPARRMHQ